VDNKNQSFKKEVSVEDILTFYIFYQLKKLDAKLDLILAEIKNCDFSATQ